MTRSRKLKAISLALGQRRALDRADLLHATSEQEASDIRAFGLSGRVAVVPNAVQLPSPATSPEDDRRDGRAVLFLSRLHPKKAVDRLLAAWSAVESDFADWELRLAGPSELNHEAELRALSARLGLRRVRFVGELVGEPKSAAYRACDVFILPSHNENFGMVVAEALSYRKPVIASRGTPWRSLVEANAGWWVDNAPDSLARALREAMSLPVESLAAMGERGYQLVASRFSPEAVARQMLREYEKLLAS